MMKIVSKHKKTKNQHKWREIKSHERGKLKPFLIHQQNKIIPRVKFK